MKFNLYICSMLIMLQGHFAIAQETNSCSDNSFLYSSDPNTIEYDNMVSGYHSTIIKEVDGVVKTWGNKAHPNGSDNLYSPTEVNSTNGFNYAGEILKITMGSNQNDTQFIILTTDGLYIWGDQGVVVHQNVKSGSAFGKANPTVTANVTGTNTYSLPMGVSPLDVKMMFGSYQTLAIVTHSGEAWILTLYNYLYGDGSSGSGNTAIWHRVHKSSTVDGATVDGTLDNVVAMRGNPTAMMALTADGKVYTWGRYVLLGNDTPNLTRTYATEMVLPIGVTPKMIGMTGITSSISYYLLATTGELYALGYNGSRQLGDFTTSTSRTWIRPLMSENGSPLPPVAWISPNEHDGQHPAINVLTQDGKLWSWGSNVLGMIGGSEINMDPIFMGRGLDNDHQLIAVETGGHTTMVVEQCSKRYGYIGHRTRGSMGDGTTDDVIEGLYNFSDTAEISLCGAPAAPKVADINICSGSVPLDLDNAFVGTVPFNHNLEWWTTEDRQPGTQVIDPSDVDDGIYYAFFVPISGGCDVPLASDLVNVSKGASQVSLFKTSTFVDVDGNGHASLGDYIIYNFAVTNIGGETISDLVLNDEQIGIANMLLTPNSMGSGQTITLSFNYYITSSDIQSKSVYNMATIRGGSTMGCTVIETSVDPNPLGPSDDGYDPDRPNHTYTFLPLDVLDSLCFEEVIGELFQWNVSSGGASYSQTITQPGTNAGFVFDIYELDNSFDMEINGMAASTQEIEFQRSSGLTQNVRFKDGTIWEDGIIEDIWKLRGETNKPIVRIIISPVGNIAMLGSKVSSSNPAYVLEPLELFNGNSFNTVNWNSVNDNTIKISQSIVGPTIMDGYGYGQNFTECDTYTLTKEGVFNDENNDNAAHPGETIRYTLTVKNAGDIDIYDLKVIDPMLGGEITVLPSGDLNSNGILDTYEEWVYTVDYVITQDDIKNKGVYNLATVIGENILGEELGPETSVDTDPLSPSDPNYDSTRPDHTFVPLKGRRLIITNPHIYQRVKSN